MLIQKTEDIEEYCLGTLLGEPDLGVKVRRFTPKKIGSDYFGAGYSLEQFSLEPGKSCPVPGKTGDSIYLVQSGTANFEGKNTVVSAQAGDVVYVRSGEISAVSNGGAKPAEIICCSEARADKTLGR